jgi:hypothetical protein
MPRFRKTLIGAGAVALTGLAAALTPVGRAVAQEARLLVEVVNTPSVNVANAPRVQSAQSGAWNVGVDGPVTIRNSPAHPVPIVNVGSGAREPFHEYLSASLFPEISASKRCRSLPGKSLSSKPIPPTVERRRSPPPFARPSRFPRRAADYPASSFFRTTWTSWGPLASADPAAIIA